MMALPQFLQKLRHGSSGMRRAPQDQHGNTTRPAASGGRARDNTIAEDSMIILKRVLVATDFGAPSDAALTYGRELARTFGASLHLLHVAENQFLRPLATDPGTLAAAHLRWLDDRLTAADRNELGGRAVVEVSDSPAQAIVDYARAGAIDLIVMGTAGRSAVSQILVGSVAERVVRTAPCPVLTVRQPEHEFVIPDASQKEGSHDSPPAHSRCH
jgi:nucleotide-binding universal stress UspA family protein